MRTLEARQTVLGRQLFELNGRATFIRSDEAEWYSWNCGDKTYVEVFTMKLGRTQDHVKRVRSIFRKEKRHVRAIY